jgi:hypothetical protein
MSEKRVISRTVSPYPRSGFVRPNSAIHIPHFHLPALALTTDYRLLITELSPYQSFVVAHRFQKRVSNRASGTRKMNVPAA